jgi:hypothetical protein
MKPGSPKTVFALLALPLLLSGCSLLPTTRKLPIPKQPELTQTVGPDELVRSLNQRWDALHSLTATVEIQASLIKTKEGKAKDMEVRGHILMRKPAMLRVFGQIPLLGTRAFDMASDGKSFVLSVPHYNKAYKGSNTLKKRSENQLENLRPGAFYDAMVVRGLEPDDLYSVTADTITAEDPARKHFYLVPRYILNISRRKPDSQQLTPVRVVYFHRDDLLPYGQDIYDSEGNLETQVIYSGYRNFGSAQYPISVTIKRPLDELQITLSVEDVHENQQPDLSDDQFQIKIPDGTAIQTLE